MRVEGQVEVLRVVRDSGEGEERGFLPEKHLENVFKNCGRGNYRRQRPSKRGNAR